MYGGIKVESVGDVKGVGTCEWVGGRFQNFVRVMGSSHNDKIGGVIEYPLHASEVKVVFRSPFWA